MKRLNGMFFLSLATAVVIGSTIFAPPACAAATTYLVLFKSQAVPSDASTSITRAGGSLVYKYDPIGVAIASSSSTTFRDALVRDSRVEGVVPTAAFRTMADRDLSTTGETAILSSSAVPSTDYLSSSDPLPLVQEPSVLAGPPVPTSDPLTGLQWDMMQIAAPQARAVTGGSPSVVVGVISSGIDYTHPDLAANIDFADSVSCVGGVPNTNPAAWRDDFGVGTHSAGIIAAAANGIGIEGVAPGVKVAAIKAGDFQGFFYPEAVVCAFMWAASHPVDVVDNGYFADPWVYDCRNDPDQRAIWKAEQRAIRYAIQQGVTVVAQAGNANDDLAHPTVDPDSPDNGTPIPRDVTNACGVIPVEMPGVVGVSAVGNLLQKSYYSNYGVGTIEVTAPGGDRLFQRTPAAPNGRVLSSWPAAIPIPPALRVTDPSGAIYGYIQGSNVACAHASGVAALTISRFGRMTPGRVGAYIGSTAMPVDCPPNPFVPGGITDWSAICQGGRGSNSFYGSGQVDALSAVLHHP